MLKSQGGWINIFFWQRGIHGNDLTVRVGTDVMLIPKHRIANLTFVNWYMSAQIVSLLAALEIQTILPLQLIELAKLQYGDAAS